MRATWTKHLAQAKRHIDLAYNELTITSNQAPGYEQMWINEKMGSVAEIQNKLKAKIKEKE
jgi:hypothetical protein